MSIEIEEVGRKLKVTVGGEEEFIFSPINSQAGLVLALNLFGTMASYAAEDLGVDPNQAGLALVEATLGEHREAVLELRQEEAAQVQTAVQFWQAAGGSFDLAKRSITDPKAVIQEWAFAVSPLLRASLSSGEPTETSEAAGSTHPS